MSAVALALAACGAPRANNASDSARAATNPATSATAASAPSVNPQDWPGYNRTLAGDRFSPLTEISRSNIAQVKPVCMYNLPDVSSLTGPIVLGGTMYFTTDTNSCSINASTCAERLLAAACLSSGVS